MGSSRHGGRSFASYAPKDAGWSLDDYAYDPKAREVVSRGRIVTDSGANFDAGGGAASLPAAAAGGGKQREASKRARRPPLHTTEDFEHDAPKPAPSNGHAASKATEGLTLARVRRGKSLDSTDAPSSHRSGGGSLASAPSDPGFIHPLAGIRQCPVDDCTNCCYPSSKRRVERVLCGEHAVAPSCDVGGIPRRFCQVCYVLHGLAAFKGKNKTCTAVLQRKKVMRAQAMEGRMRATNQSGSGGGQRRRLRARRLQRRRELDERAGHAACGHQEEAQGGAEDGRRKLGERGRREQRGQRQRGASLQSSSRIDRQAEARER